MGKFFLRRPNVEDLMKRGIMKNEPVFGSTLLLLARQDHSEVPLFVQRCISIMESRPEYSSKAPPANRPGQPCCSRLSGRRPRSHWSSQTLLPRASGASYPVGGCGEAACCCESAEQEGEAETVKGNYI